ncbi:galactose-specific lectin nattectin-like [Symphorus nematophorus]
MSFTMKMLAVSVLVIAMMALIGGVSAEEAYIQARAVDTESPPTETPEEEADEPETESDEDDTEDDTTDEAEHKVDKRAVRCPCYWTLFRGRCYRYFPGARTWAQAKRHCQQMGANLASIHNRYEDNWIKRFVRYRPTWVGFSDAQQERFWFWHDGTRYTYANWCRGEPSDRRHVENCLQINWTARKCWDDIQCHYRKGYVCARR